MQCLPFPTGEEESRFPRRLPFDVPMRRINSARQQLVQGDLDGVEALVILDVRVGLIEALQDLFRDRESHGLCEHQPSEQRQPVIAGAEASPHQVEVLGEQVQIEFHRFPPRLRVRILEERTPGFGPATKGESKFPHPSTHRSQDILSAQQTFLSSFEARQRIHES